jgi:DnaJ-class molecular chaperone
MAAAGPRTSASEWTARFGEPGQETIDFSEFFGQFNQGGRGGAGAHGEEGGAGIFEDLLGRMRSSRGARQRGGQSVEAHLQIPFLTAVRGGETSINVQHADGKTENLVVKIPPGVDTGRKIRLKGQGEPGGKSAPPGDLIIVITVEPHPYFKREDRNLTVEVPITVPEAILGARIEVPSLDGMKSLTIPAGSSSGQKLRLKGQGVPASGGKPEGDLFVQLKIVVPRNIDDESRKLIQEFADHNKQHPRAGLW